MIRNPGSRVAAMAHAVMCRDEQTLEASVDASSLIIPARVNVVLGVGVDSEQDVRHCLVSEASIRACDSAI